MNEQLTKKEAEKLLYSTNEADVTNILLYVCLNFEDWEWVQDACLKLLNSENENICGLAITCLGHIARIHSKIDKKKVLPILKSMNANKKLTGRVEDALEDINTFAE